MGLFDFVKPKPLPRWPPESSSQIPVEQFDIDKRYDLYCTIYDKENRIRLYENVRLVGIRTFDRISEFSSGVACGFLEIETPNGSRMAIPNFGIQMICEHGTKPTYRILKVPE